MISYIQNVVALCQILSQKKFVNVLKAKQLEKKTNKSRSLIESTLNIQVS